MLRASVTCSRFQIDTGALQRRCSPDSLPLPAQSIGQDLFGEFTCLSPCFGGYECLWQSTYLGPCDSPESRWLWDNATQHLRQRSTPDICLTMCPTQVSGAVAALSS